MMLTWDKQLATGVSQIDDQHKKLFECTNKLLITMKEGKGKEEALQTLDFLEKYVIKHFKEEEELQIRNDYPKYTIQHAEHEEFKNQLKELRKVFETTGVSALFVINMQQKMTAWWRKHICDLDKDLGMYLIQKDGSF